MGRFQSWPTPCTGCLMHALGRTHLCWPGPFLPCGPTRQSGHSSPFDHWWGTEDVVKAAGFVASAGANMTVVASHLAVGAISISVSAAKLLAFRERSPTGLSQRRLAAHCSEGGGHDKQGCRSVIEHFVDVGTQFFSRIHEERCAGAGFWYATRSLPP